MIIKTKNSDIIIYFLDHVIILLTSEFTDI